ncbi:MAG: serine hydrolase domain-containing protein [Acidobacteriota bacterium]
MRRLFLSLTAAIFLCLANPVEATTWVELYSTLTFRESPYSPHQGVHRLTAAQAETRNHYRFELDDQGRVRRIAFQLGDRPRAPNHTGNYFWYASSEEHEYRDRLELVTYRDHHGLPTAVHGEVAVSRYQLDEQGRRTALEYLDVDRRPIESRWGIARYEWQHGDDGSVTERRFDLAGEAVSLRPNFPFGAIRLAYDVRGFTRLMQQVDSQGVVIGTETGFAQDRFTLSAAGELLRYDVLDLRGRSIAANMQRIASGLQTFTRWGYESVATYLDAAGEPTYNDYGWWRSERHYDDFGNMTRSTFQDLAGRLKNNPELGFAEIRIGWHEDGLRRRQLSYFDEQGVAVNHLRRGYHAVQYEYDERHRLRQIRLADAAGHLTEHALQGWAVRRFQYTGSSPRPTEVSLSLEELRTEDLDQTLDQLRSSTAVPGLAAAVAVDGELLWSGATGLRNVDHATPVDGQTLFRLASVSKAVTSLVVARALHAGSLDLETRVSDLLPMAHKATLAQLLAHTGSVSHYHPSIRVDLDHTYASSRAALAIVEPHLLAAAPGREYLYSTFGYTLAAAMIEAATGRPFATLVRELAEAEGLESLQALGAEPGPSNSTHFYSLDGRSVRPARRRNFTYSHGGAGLGANATDLARLASRFAAGRVPTPEIRDRILTVQRLASGEPVRDRRYEIALGWRRQTGPTGETFFHHSGITDGARSVVLIHVPSATAVALLSNSSWGGDMFATARAFFAGTRGPLLAVEDLGPATLHHEGAESRLKSAGCLLSRCRWNPEKKDDLSRWLAESQRGGDYLVELGPTGGRIYSPCGVSPLEADALPAIPTTLAGEIGRQRIELRFRPPSPGL